MIIKRRNFWIVLTALALVVNLGIGYRVYSTEKAPEQDADALEKLTIMMRVMHLIRQDYVDEGKTGYESLIYDAMHGMVSQLDPHSSFMEPRDYETMMETTEGHFGGIGIIVTMRNNVLTVVSPIEDTPGSKSDLRAGDQIIEIDGESTQDMKLQDAVKRMKGEPGSEVELTIYRPKTEETLTKTIVRADIEVTSVKDAHIIKDGIGYVRITQFDEMTAEKMQEALASLSEKGMTSVILDLRNNPGGLLTSAVEVCSYFLPRNELVVYTEGRRPSQKNEYFTVPQPKTYELPVAILINEGSASASEIVAGCLRDKERGMLVGETTFGKGSVQNVIPLPDGSALRLTTAMYYTPKRQIIHEQGIEPDITVPLSQDEMREVAEARLEAMQQGENMDHAKDPQLRRAVETLESYERYRSALKSE